MAKRGGLMIGLAGLILLAGAAPATIRTGAVTLQSGTVVDAANRLKPGEYLWAADIAPKGPVMLVVSLSTQRAVLYRNGVPIGVSTVSTGRPGYETPTGVFVVLQKHVEHYSSTYDNAPMPYMQRLTWRGIALHAGKLPGYPASHGCIRLPLGFARLLYDVTHRGMTVVITRRPDVPRVAPSEVLLSKSGMALGPAAALWWDPDRSPKGPLSVIVSAADKRLVVLRNGVVIGTSAIELDGAINRTTAYVLNGVVDGERSWSRIGLPGQDDRATEALRGRLRVSPQFRALIDPVLTTGTTVIVTGDSLSTGQAGQSVNLIEDEGAPAVPAR